MKVFISQPMNGLSDKEILDQRAKAVEEIGNLGYEDFDVIDSFIVGAQDSGKSPLWLLGETIKKLSEADCIYFAKGWSKSRGCNIEYECAVKYDVPIIVDIENNFAINS